MQPYMTKHPERITSNNVAERAINRGDLVRGPCIVCGGTYRVAAHHHDYRFPLDVTWLCNSCHSKLRGSTLEAQFGIDTADKPDVSERACSVCANDYARRMIEPDPAESLASNEEAWALLAHLRLRDALIIIRRFGLDGSPTLSLAETGALFGFTGERIRQL